MELDWSLCVICQRKTSEALKCPLENPVKKGNKIDAYMNFLNRVKKFQDIDCLPVKFGCDETAENWEFHRASWRKSCYAKFSSCKLEIAKLKRKRSSDSTSGKHVQLPEIYTTVPDVAMAKSYSTVPEVKVAQTKLCLDKALEAENEGVQNSTRLLKKKKK